MNIARSRPLLCCTRLLLAFVLGLASARATSGQVETWQSLGPEAATVLSTAIDPLSTTTIYVGTDGGGVFKSADGGQSWRPSSDGLTGLTVRLLAIDPSTPAILYAATNAGFFTTTDTGVTWHAIDLGLNPSFSYDYSLVIDPGGTVYAGNGVDVFVSTDKGDTWRSIAVGLPLNLGPTYFGGPSLRQNYSVLAVDPVTSAVYAGAWRGVIGNACGLYKRDGVGGDWRRIGIFVPAGEYAKPAGYICVNSLIVDPLTPTTLYAMETGGTNGSYLKSTDGGNSWEGITPVRASPVSDQAARIEFIAIDPVTPTTLYLGTSTQSADQNLVGIFKSIDGGNAWQAVGPGLPSPGSGLRLTIDPLTPTTLYASVIGGLPQGVFISRDGGANWRGRNTGLTNAVIRAQVIDAISPATLYIAAGSQGANLLRTRDAGVTWQRLDRCEGVPSAPGRSASALAIDPLTPTTLYSNFYAVCKSTDGGKTWHPSHDGLVDSQSRVRRPDSFAIDPLTPTIVYAAVNSAGVFKSVDAGAHWYAVNTGLLNSTSLVVREVAVDPRAPDTVYATTHDGLFKSTDGGDSWVNLNVPFRLLAISPSASEVLYARDERALRQLHPGETILNGLFKSFDGGGQWYAVATELNEVSAVAIDPLTPTTIYAAARHASSTSRYGVFVSIDSGVTWRAMDAGLTGAPVVALTIDPITPTTLYAGTAGSGLFVLRDAPSGPRRRRADGGTAIAVPGTVQAEDYDLGGPGIGYLDTTPGNDGGGYRTDDVDIKPSREGGFAVGWLAAGEWLAYTLDVASDGLYTIRARVGSLLPGRTFHLEVNGRTVTGAVAVPQADDWDHYATVSIPGIALRAGIQVLRVVMGPEDFMDFQSFTVASEAPTRLIPGRIEAEDYDGGGAGVGYLDTTPGNEQGDVVYRNDDVDIKTSAEGGHAIGWLTAGEWLAYTVAAPEAGTYTWRVRVGTPLPGRTFHIDVDGHDVTGPVSVPETAGWDQYVTLDLPPVSLTAGPHLLRVVMGPEDFIDLQWLEIDSLVADVEREVPAGTQVVEVSRR